MDINKIDIGINPPNDVNVIIEVPLGGDPVKYELDKESGAIFVDRFLHTSMFYPGNYGFIPHTLSEDGDPTDVLVVGRTPVMPGAVMRVKPVGVMMMEDEAGLDEKIIAVSHSSLHSYHADIKTYKDLPEISYRTIEHFFTHYKDLEENKWVKVIGWGDVDKAEELIIEAIKRHKNSK